MWLQGFDENYIIGKVYEWKKIITFLFLSKNNKIRCVRYVILGPIFLGLKPDLGLQVSNRKKNNYCVKLPLGGNARTLGLSAFHRE